jgi:hypothetical protein
MTARTPKTWDLLGAFTIALQAIRVSDGYFTDAGALAKCGREPKQVPAADGIALSVGLEALQRPEDPAMKRAGWLAGVVVRIRVGTDLDDAQLRLHELVDDVRQAMFNRHDVFPAGTQYPRFVEARFIPAAEGVTWVGADLLYTAHLIPQ